MKIQLPALLLISLAWSTQTLGQEHKHGSAYSGQEAREVKSLSAEDIAELKRGGGWGLAKAAELNGVPGPAHLLDLKDEIPLDPSQVVAIEDLFQTMNRRAINQGRKLIALEKELEQHFRNRSITDGILRRVLDEIAKVRTELRYVHLSTHLQTTEILSPDQVRQYNSLRGYKG